MCESEMYLNIQMELFNIKKTSIWYASLTQSLHFLNQPPPFSLIHILSSQLCINIQSLSWSLTHITPAVHVTVFVQVSSQG